MDSLILRHLCRAPGYCRFSLQKANNSVRAIIVVVTDEYSSELLLTIEQRDVD